MQLIQVHGRSALELPITQTGVDLSTLVLFFECPSARIRKALIAHPTYPKGRLISLTVAEVERLPTAAGLWCVRNETDPARPVVYFEGSIQRTGYVGVPDAV